MKMLDPTHRLFYFISYAKKGENTKIEDTRHETSPTDETMARVVI